jgi:DNA-binding CsgD family transcriptional regulator
MTPTVDHASDDIVTVVTGLMPEMFTYGVRQALVGCDAIRLLGHAPTQPDLARLLSTGVPSAIVVGDAVTVDLLRRLGSQEGGATTIVFVRHPSPLYDGLLCELGCVRLEYGAPAAQLQAAIVATALPPRTREVYRYVNELRTDGEIALALGIGVRTVHSHTAAIRQHFAACGVPYGRPSRRSPSVN